MKAIKERAIEQQYISKNKAAELAIEDIKNKATQAVAQKRNMLKQRIADMRKKAEKSKRKMNQKLMAMRSEIASKMQNAYKVGDANHCALAGKPDQYQTNYCIANFSDDYGKFNDCKDPDEFCNLCCDFEFGEMHTDERNKCKTEKCTAATGANSANGRWVWQAPVTA